MAYEQEDVLKSDSLKNKHRIFLPLSLSFMLNNLYKVFNLNFLIIKLN